MSMTNEHPSGEATRIAEAGPVLTVSRWTPQMDARLLEMRRERMSSAGIIRIIGLEFGEFFSRNAILQHAWYLENRESQLEYKRQWYQDRRRLVQRPQFSMPVRIEIARPENGERHDCKNPASAVAPHCKDIQTEMTYTFVIPGKPVAKGRPRFAMRGIKAIAYTPDKTKQWERGAKLIIKAGMKGKPPLEGPVYVLCEFAMPKPKKMKRSHHTIKPDIDNLIKSVNDALNGIVLVDDAQIVEVSACKFYSDAPCVVIGVTKREDLAMSEMADGKLQPPHLPRG